jgi:hypothetical protein
MPPTSVEPIAHGYQIHIKTVLDGQTEKCMQDVINNYVRIFLDNYAPNAKATTCAIEAS